MKDGIGKSNGHAIIIDTIYGLHIIESPSLKDYSDFPPLLSMKPGIFSSMNKNDNRRHKIYINTTKNKH
ncbi:Uncharacterised protein [uncultured archaeon]|nr:Uncharacterised protein [uncultured archaeon]